MKSSESLKKFRSLGAEGLKAKVLDMEETMMNLRFRHASGQLEQTTQMRIIRKDVARAQTILREISQSSDSVSNVVNGVSN